MKQTKLKTKKIFLLAIIPLLLITGIVQIKLVNASSSNSINSMDIDVYIGKNGDAHITETWDMNVYEGTEVYKVMQNMSVSEITNLKVTDNTGASYTNIGVWNVDASKDEKENKCGLVNDGDYYEICFGIGEYGERTYTFEYDVTNFIKQYNDYQGCKFTFFSDMSLDIAEATVAVSSYFKMDTNEVVAYDFGYSGSCIINNGKVIMKSSESLSNSDSMQLILQFNNDCFENVVSIDNTLTNVVETTESENSKDVLSKFILYINAFIVVLVALAIFLFNAYFDEYKLLKSEYTFEDDQPINYKRIRNRKEILNCDVYELYYLGKKLHLVSDCERLVDTVIFCNIIDNYDKENTKNIKRKNKTTSIDLSKMKINNKLDKKLVSLLSDALPYKNQSILGFYDFSIWCQSNYHLLKKWADDAEKYIKKRYKSSKDMTYKRKPHDTSLWNNMTIKLKTEVYSLEIKEKMEKLIGLYNYMNHSSKSELAEMYNEDKFYFVVSNLFEIKGYPESEEDSFAIQEEYDEYENNNNIDMLKEIVDMYYEIQYSIDILHNLIGEAHYIYDQSKKVSSSSSSSGSYDSSSDSFGGFSGGGGGGTR